MQCSKQRGELLASYFSLVTKSVFGSWFCGHLMSVCAKSLQSCLTLCDPMDGSPQVSSVHRILQARILQWVAMPSPPQSFLLLGMKSFYSINLITFWLLSLLYLMIFMSYFPSSHLSLCTIFCCIVFHILISLKSGSTSQPVVSEVQWNMVSFFFFGKFFLSELFYLLPSTEWGSSFQPNLVLIHKFHNSERESCSVHRILQARILEWVAFPFSRGSSQPRYRIQVSLIVGGFFTSWATREAQEYWSG